MKNLILKIIVLIGLIGSVIYFPVNIGNRYTCLYHRLFDAEQAYCPVYGQCEMEANHTHMQEGAAETQGFVQLYIHKYAWFWWGSLSGLAIILLIRLNKTQEETV